MASRRLIWVGLYGVDAQPLDALPQFSHCFSLRVPLQHPRIPGVAAEDRLGLRASEQGLSAVLALKVLHDEVASACGSPAAIVAFAPFPFFADLLGEYPHASHLGSPWDEFEALNQKRYVEDQLRAFAPQNLNFIDWRPLPQGSSRVEVVRDELARHPIVLRTASSHAGVGHELLTDEAMLASSRLLDDPSAVLGPFLAEHIPVTVSACVFPNGDITLHCPAIQLIGLSHAKSAFTYCGNDTGAIRQLPRPLLDDLDACARTVGRWLHRRGYVGAFGVDALVHEGRLLFGELNPRFQGSIRISNALDAALGRPDILQDHLMAWLGIPAIPSPPLAELVAAQPARSQVLLFNNSAARTRVRRHDAPLPEGAEMLLAPAEHVLVDPGELAFVLEFERSVTTDGRSLEANIAATVQASLATALETQDARRRGRR
ncbi:MAG: hypothetical protein K1X87_07410 [Dehalococcoidia bacterium]|nr:hypothetical protein [Dehalococcoidia bacterium]HRC62664.1 hypothetical protein [Dehalococcoidia bacterium]